MKIRQMADGTYTIVSSANRDLVLDGPFKTRAEAEENLPILMEQAEQQLEN